VGERSVDGEDAGFWKEGVGYAMAIAVLAIAFTAAFPPTRRVGDWKSEATGEPIPTHYAQEFDRFLFGFIPSYAWIGMGDYFSCRLICDANRKFTNAFATPKDDEHLLHRMAKRKWRDLIGLDFRRQPVDVNQMQAARIRQCIFARDEVQNGRR
jgi:hypothetical protein